MEVLKPNARLLHFLLRNGQKTEFNGTIATKDFFTGNQQFLIWVEPETAPALGPIYLNGAICHEQIQA